MKKGLSKFLIFFLILGIDFCTKFWVIHFLPIMQTYLGYPFGGIGILESPLLTVSIVHAKNMGAAWGLFSNFQTFLLYVRLLISLGLLAYLAFFKPPKHMQIPLILILAGALGNILDTFLYGHVIDMIYCIFYRYSYPIFNVADSAIFCATFYLIIYSLRKKQKIRHAFFD